MITSKKRKRSNQINIPPPLKKIEYLKCDICQNKVFGYKQCQNNWIYCSHDCLCVLFLNYINEHECNYSNFTEYFLDNQS